MCYRIMKRSQSFPVFCSNSRYPADSQEIIYLENELQCVRSLLGEEVNCFLQEVEVVELGNRRVVFQSILNLALAHLENLT